MKGRLDPSPPVLEMSNNDVFLSVRVRLDNRNSKRAQAS
jgi:hypothetical protein